MSHATSQTTVDDIAKAIVARVHSILVDSPTPNGALGEESVSVLIPTSSTLCYEQICNGADTVSSVSGLASASVSINLLLYKTCCHVRELENLLVIKLFNFSTALIIHS